MESKFKQVILHKSEKANETWVNPDHIVSITPDPDKRFMVLVLDTIVVSGFGSTAKTYRATYESGGALLKL
ncbi:MAG: hypothetical protein ACI8PQ_002906 [Planctomycetota bacterium]|jgi:hypothetical protein